MTTTASLPGASPSPARPDRLTLALLTEHVPVIRAGADAAVLLERAAEDGTALPSAEAAAARAAVRAGERSKTVLYQAAAPLIRSIAAREHRRRAQWNSPVPFEDLLSEATVGFFKGLNAYKPDAAKTSPTNYLGQWILVEMRRGAEAMEHDLAVGHDAGERFRRVRGLRSRLFAELGREPSDAEIAEASRNPDLVTRPGLVGRAGASAAGRGLTEAQVAEERAARARTGQVERIASGDSDEADAPGVIDASRVAAADTGTPTDPADLLADADRAVAVSGLVAHAIDALGLGDAQAGIVARRYGLAPFGQGASVREIARETGLHRDRVAKVLAAFAEQMTAPGGPVHRVLSLMGEDDIYALGLGWLADALGPWDAATARAVPDVLTAPQAAAAGAAGEGARAWFRCDYTDDTFPLDYPAAGDVPTQVVCPDCGRAAQRYRLLDLATGQERR